MSRGAPSRAEPTGVAESPAWRGPWRIDSDWALEIYDANGWLVAKLPPNRGDYARLIAAAPELFEALHALMANLRGKSKSDGSLMRRAEAALSKATTGAEGGENV